MTKGIQHFRDDTRGQAMVIAAAAMFVVMLMAALAIDTAAGYQRRHQAQVAADAASLAAANCLADAGETGDACTSTTDTTDAVRVATTIAAAALRMTAARAGWSPPASIVTIASGIIGM